jgi:hypothetical protein
MEKKSRSREHRKGEKQIWTIPRESRESTSFPRKYEDAREAERLDGF